MDLKPKKEFIAPWDLKKNQLNHYRNDFLTRYNEIKPHLMRHRHNYKIALKEKPKIKLEEIKKETIVKALEHEKKEIDLRLRTLENPIYLRELDRATDDIDRKIKKLDQLVNDNYYYRECIDILKKKILETDRCLAKSEAQLYSGMSRAEYVGRVQRQLNDIKNRYEAFIRLEGKIFLENENMRKMIINMLFERSTFNKLWIKMNIKLNRDKWYLIDIFEYAMSTFDHSIDVYNMMQAIDHKFKKREYDLIMAIFGSEEDIYDRALIGGHRDLKDEEEKHKIDIHNILRKITTEKDAYDFIRMKTQLRESAGEQPLRYAQRREISREWYHDTLESYKRILKKVLPNGVDTLSKTIAKCEDQENFRYSYYVYMSDINHQVVNLKSNIQDLYHQIDILKSATTKRIDTSVKSLENIEKLYEKENRKTKALIGTKDDYEKRSGEIFQNLSDIIRKSNCDTEFFQYLLGDYSRINDFNLRKFLKILQSHLNFIIFCVNMTKYDEKHVTEYLKEPTPLHDIVLVHQCPECAERDDVIYDFGPTRLMTMEEIRKKLRKKVKFPNMRERLHSIDQCSMPRSRLIRPRRYFNDLLSLL